MSFGISTVHLASAARDRVRNPDDGVHSVDFPVRESGSAEIGCRDVT